MEQKSPEELLEEILYLLRKGDRDAIYRAYRIFSRNSDDNHSSRFSTALRSLSGVRKVGEYVVLFYGRDRKSGFISVVGLDENYRFFCHVLPGTYSCEDFVSFDESKIRDIMGFDVHVWEAKSLYPGLRIRFQGDIVLTLERIFEDDKQILNVISLFIAHQLAFYVVLDINTRLAWEIFRGIYEFRFYFDDIDKLVKFLLNITRDYYKEIKDKKALLHFAMDPNTNIDDFIKNYDKINSKCISYVYKTSILLCVLYLFLDKSLLHEAFNSKNPLAKLIKLIPVASKKSLSLLPNLERRYRITLGNHTIKLTGIFLPLLIVRSSPLGMEYRPPNRAIFIVLREQVISAIHAQHGCIDLKIPPCVLAIGTLLQNRLSASMLQILMPILTVSTLSRLEYQVDSLSDMELPISIESIVGSILRIAGQNPSMHYVNFSISLGEPRNQYSDSLIIFEEMYGYIVQIEAAKIVSERGVGVAFEIKISTYGSIPEYSHYMFASKKLDKEKKPFLQMNDLFTN